MHSYIYSTATELALLIKNGSVSSTEIVKQHFTQIHAHNKQINALIFLFEEQALQRALEADEALKRGEIWGPLHGVPVTVKEQYWIKGTPCTLNAKMYKGFIAPEDAVVVERLKKSGAIIIGRTNVPAHLTDFQTKGDIYPEGKNPYNMDYTPGGSTGGGAAALAAGFTPLELGGDFGGSARIPPAFCGVYGLKPTDKTVPLKGNRPILPGMKGGLVQMVQPSMLARSAEDMRLLWEIIRGPHESDRSIAPVKWESPSGKSLKEYRIAWADGWDNYPVSQQTRTSINNLINSFTAAGGFAEEKIPDNMEHSHMVDLYILLFSFIAGQDMPWYVKPFFKKQLRNGVVKGRKDYQKNIAKGLKMKVKDYAQALKLKAELIQDWEFFFTKYDFFVCPVAYGPAFKRCEVGDTIKYDGIKVLYPDYCVPYVTIFNATGHPALVIPLGLSEEGLPMSVQIVGPYWSEPELLHFASQLSSILPSFIKPRGF